jgi:beta-glucanase (GH16 family)
MVSSYGNFSITYGYFEIRAKMPKGKGLWPAFWLLPQDGEWPPEIDVLELLCQDTQTVYTTLHFKTADNPHLSSGLSTQTDVDLSAGFHRYGVDWTPAAIVWYLDGIEIYRVKYNIPAQPMYILANLAVGGDWPGSPNSTTIFPAYFEIDYIRVYRDPSLPVPAFTPPAP